jgi:putative flippase GtrA
MKLLANKTLAFNALGELMRFGFVGVTAASVQYLGVTFFVEVGQVRPLLANLFAFLFAVWVSYFGHKYFSFKAGHIGFHQSIRRFFIIVITTFCLNEVLYYVLLHRVKLHYQRALLITIFVVAVINFLCNKLWTFRE